MPLKQKANKVYCFKRSESKPRTRRYGVKKSNDKREGAMTKKLKDVHLKIWIAGNRMFGGKSSMEWQLRLMLDESF